MMMSSFFTSCVTKATSKLSERSWAWEDMEGQGQSHPRQPACPSLQGVDW